MSASRGLGAIALSFLIPILSLFSTDRSKVPVPESLTPTFVTPEIKRLQDYLRIRTDHGPPRYFEAIDFLNKTASTLLPAAKVSSFELVPGKPVLLLSLQGTNASLPSLLLNSHTDVVPAEPEKWSYEPFAARLVYAKGEWRIYARGAQDMKSVGMQYLEALSALWKSGWRPDRSVHVSFVPDEEIGGRDGMGAFVKAKVFQELNIGVALDEGLPNPESKYNVYYGERQTWWWTVSVTGSPGHGATFPETSASQILHRIIGRALSFRETQFVKLNSSESDIGDVVGVNLVYLKAGQPDERQPTGYVMNMVPSTAEAGFDIRVPPAVDHEEMDKLIQSWITCENGDLCPGVSHRFVIKVLNPLITSRSKSENPYVSSFMRGLATAGISERLRHGIFFAATDARYLRENGIPSFGFSPIEETPNLLHKHDEYITMNGYHKGCKIYEEIIQHLAGPLREDDSLSESEFDGNDVILQENKTIPGGEAPDTEDSIPTDDLPIKEDFPVKEDLAAEDTNAKEDL